MLFGSSSSLTNGTCNNMNMVLALYVTGHKFITANLIVNREM